MERVLGQGGFGIVYLAHDDQLQRLVAIKVPHARLVCRPEDAEACLAETHTAAGLDHPNIVPVYDVGSTEQFPCYVFSKYIDGTDLATRLKRSRLLLNEAVELVATVAEALHHAHKQGLVHRDIKPGNILLDKSGKPYVADFGLALKEGGPRPRLEVRRDTRLYVPRAGKGRVASGGRKVGKFRGILALALLPHVREPAGYAPDAGAVVADVVAEAGVLATILETITRPDVARMADSLRHRAAPPSANLLSTGVHRLARDLPAAVARRCL